VAKDDPRLEPAAGAGWTAAALEQAAQALESKPPEAVLRWALAEFSPDIALACSFGAEDVVLLDMAAGIDRSLKVFYLDTELLFPETYQTRDRLAARYGVSFLQYRPALTVEGQAMRYGPELWRRDPDRCCGLRKVEPLRRALRGLRAWITGIRREQTPARKDARTVEWDARFGLVKINPLVRWTWQDVWRYIGAHQVPCNPLHDQGYPSLGCVHCTAPVKPGEDPRSGRWPGRAKKDCGLHG